MKSLQSDNFFKILAIGINADDAAKFTCRVELDPAHTVYDGHFPGNPVVPGVCLIQMIKEVIEHHVSREFLLSRADEVKFMSLVNPEKNGVLDMEITLTAMDDNATRANVIVRAGETVSLKFRGMFNDVMIDVG